MITILQNQSLADVALQYTGDVNNCFEIAAFNNLSIAGKIPPGTKIEIPKSLQRNEELVTFFHGIRPASVVNEELIKIKPLSGVNYWVIEETFEVQ